jgi:hypothetical protein
MTTPLPTHAPESSFAGGATSSTLTALSRFNKAIGLDLAIAQIRRALSIANARDGARRSLCFRRLNWLRSAAPDFPSSSLNTLGGCNA